MMFCPNCAELQTNEITQFCSKCGFPTGGVKRLLENDGVIDGGNQISSRQKGVKKGAKLILLSLILFPAFILCESIVKS